MQAKRVLVVPLNWGLGHTTRMVPILRELTNLKAEVYFGGSPVQIMIASQAVSPLVMPLFAIFTWRVLLKKEVVGEHRNSLWMNVGLGVTVLFTLYMLGIAVTGFLGAGFGL